jgi:putative membrane protein
MDTSPTGDGAANPEPGLEPDVQLSFANERTFLAWNRTALALVTAGLAVTQLLPPFDVPGGRRMIGIPLIVLGVVIALSSLWQWRANERAMVEGRPLPESRLPMLVALVIGITALVALGLAAFGGGQGS